MKIWLALALVVVCTCVRAAEPLAWPQFRGPDGSGIAEGQEPPVEVGVDKNVKWKIAVPSGLSSPIVVGDKLVLTAFDDGKLYTIAYNRADGKEAWRADAGAKEIEKFHKIEGSPAASTPVTDGQRIVSYFGSCGLVCYDTAGKELWKYEMPVVETPMDFGTGVSPVLADGVVIVVRDERKDPKIVAVDLATGKLKWEMKRDSTSAFCTPTVWDTPTGKQVVVAGVGRMIGYDLATGKEVWSVAGMPSACCASPMTAHGKLFFAGWSPGASEDKDFKMPSFDDMVKPADADGDGALSKAESPNSEIKEFFDSQDRNKDGMLTREEWDASVRAMAEGKNSAFVLRPGGIGDVTKTHMLWKKTKGLPYVASAIVCGGQCVMIKDGGLVTAYDEKTGDDVYLQQRVLPSGSYYASPVAADGKIYFTSLADGVITVIKAGAPNPEIVVQNEPLGERTAATPAIADNTLYVRTAGHLYAFAVK